MVGLGFFWDGCCGHSVDFIGNPGAKTLIKTLVIADSGHLNGHFPIKLNHALKGDFVGWKL